MTQDFMALSNIGSLSLHFLLGGRSVNTLEIKGQET